MFTVRFKNFWQGFDINANIFTNFLRTKNEVLVVEDFGTMVDLEIVSVFKPRETTTLITSALKRIGLDNSATKDGFEDSLSRRRVWYTGENIRPPMHLNFDAFMSFDQDSYAANNFYFPLYFLKLNPFGKNWDSQLNMKYTVSQLLESRELSRQRNKRVCAFVGNPEPIRMKAIDLFQERDGIDLFGKSFNNPVPHKSVVLNKYDFIFAFENDLYPGYVTEKIIDAYLLGAIPLFLGNFGKDSYINRECVLDLTQSHSLEEFVNSVCQMSDSEFIDIYRQPLLIGLPPINELLESILLG